MPSIRALALPVLLLSLAFTSTAQAEELRTGETDPQAPLLRAAVAALCESPEASADILAIALDGLAGPNTQVSHSEDQEIPGRPFLIAIRALILPDGAELRTRAVHQEGRALRVTAEVYRPGTEGTPNPIVQATTAPNCSIREGRRIAYDAEGRAAHLLFLDRKLKATGQKEPLNPPVPTGTDPGGVTVALVDSGIAYTLPLFENALGRDADGQSLGYDFWELDDRPYDGNPARSPFFPIRHGTTVASVLLREAPGLRLIPYRYPRPKMARMADLVAHGVKHGARLFVMALGSNRPEEWTAFAEAARARPDILFVVSAGNNGRDIDQTPVFPAALDLENMLVVTSSDDFGRLAEGSNWGKESVDLMVPGEQIEVVDHRGASGKASGSSYAVPRVGALAARLLSAHPQWTAGELKTAILARAKPSPYERKPRVRIGWIINPAEDP